MEPERYRVYVEVSLEDRERLWKVVPKGSCSAVLHPITLSAVALIEEFGPHMLVAIRDGEIDFAELARKHMKGDHNGNAG